MTERLQQTIVAGGALWMLAIGAIIAIVSMAPLYEHLKQDVETKLLLNLHTRTVAVEEYLASIKEGAKQISSSTKARELLEPYHQGKLKRQELVKISQNLLTEALKTSPQVAGITRLDRNGNLAIQVGLAIPAKFWSLTGDSLAPMVSAPVTIGDESYMVVGVSIINSQSGRVGTDIVLLKLSRLQRIVQDDTGLGAGGETVLGAIANDRVHLVLPLRKNQGGGVGNLSKQSIIAAAFALSRQQKTGIVPADPNSGNPDAIAISPIADTNWSISA